MFEPNDSMSPLDVIEEETPLESVEEKYVLEENEKLISTVPLTNWESFLKILDMLIKESDNPIIISNSNITHSVNNSILSADLTDIFKNKKMNLHIPNPKKWVRIFKELKTSENIYIIERTDKNLFIITDGEVRLFLPKQIESVANAKMPSIDDSVSICEKLFEKDVRDKILNLGKGVQFIEYLFTNNELKAISIPDIGVYIFKEHVDEKNIKQISEKNADLTLRTSMFLPFISDEYNVIFGRRSNDSYFSYMTCKIGLVSIKLFETLDDASGGNIFI